jgi:protein-tyrosine phosphatase
MRSFPCLDLLPPPADVLDAAADDIEAARAQGPVLVACALGYGRSAAAIAHWLVKSGRAGNHTAAIARIREARPRIVAGALPQFTCTNTARRFCAQAASLAPSIAGRSLP